MANVRRSLGSLKRHCQGHWLWAQRRIVFSVPLDQVPAVHPSVPVLFRFGSPGDLEAIPVEMDYSEQTREFSRGRMKAGDRLVVGSLQDRIVFYAWLMKGALDLSGGRLICTAPNRAYSYMVYTDVSCRGQRIAPAYYYWAAQALRGESCSELLCHILSGNRASVAAHTRVGFAPIGSFWEFRTGSQLRFFVPGNLREKLKH